MGERGQRRGKESCPAKGLGAGRKVDKKNNIFYNSVEQGVLETPVHLLEDCSAYSDLRVGLSPTEVLQDRVTFLRSAITRRIKLEDKIRTRL